MDQASKKLPTKADVPAGVRKRAGNKLTLKTNLRAREKGVLKTKIHDLRNKAEKMSQS